MAQMVYDEDGMAMYARWEIAYEGVLFEGDRDGWNRHECDNFNDAMGFYHAYPDIITVIDNEYGVSYANGEWR